MEFLYILVAILGSAGLIIMLSALASTSCQDVPPPGEPEPDDYPRFRDSYGLDEIDEAA